MDRKSFKVFRRRVKERIRYALAAQFCRVTIRPLIRNYCIGQGLEIGAGKQPYCNPGTTLFLDKFTDNRDGTPNPDIISDASIIPIPDETFDYVISSHVLEHMQNTIAALKEWCRILKEGGILFLVLPHGDRTFDRYRDKTTLEHHISDYENLTDEYDYSHNEEIKIGWSKNDDFDGGEKYEQEWGAPVWDFDFRLKNGVIHFHVWTQDEIVRLLQYLDLKIMAVVEKAPERSDSFVVVARKTQTTCDK
uniref:Methyltransferase domain-containing protein n=1 Tax=Candidatus Kentrum sp. DK TaxID=2126562 RepID=A0A450T6D4_9GAMM|nr:MAG: Methyltransferase domain-containing protein [Candidatus Kentron sp. DK]